MKTEELIKFADYAKEQYNIHIPLGLIKEYIKESQHPIEQEKVKITKVICPECKNEEGIKYNAFTNTHTCKCGKRWLAF